MALHPWATRSQHHSVASLIRPIWRIFKGLEAAETHIWEIFKGLKAADMVC